MNQAPSPSGEQLVNTLQSLGLEFIMGRKTESAEIPPVDLITALAQSEEARLRLSLIPLFLAYPEFSAYVAKAARELRSSALLTLKCYYSAAVFLQQIHHDQLNKLLGKKNSLPDLFSIDLGIETSTNMQDNLKALAKRQQIRSHTHINWLGTYEHAIEVWMKGLELQRS